MWAPMIDMCRLRILLHEYPNQLPGVLERIPQSRLLGELKRIGEPCRSRAPSFDALVEPGPGSSRPSGGPGRGKLNTKEIINMRVMVLVKATKDSEAGIMPSEQLLTEM